MRHSHFLLCFVLALTGCASTSRTAAPPPTRPTTTQHGFGWRILHPFTPAPKVVVAAPASKTVPVATVKTRTTVVKVSPSAPAATPRPVIVPTPPAPARHGLLWRTAHPFSDPTIRPVVAAPAPAPLAPGTKPAQVSSISLEPPQEHGLLWRSLHPFSSSKVVSKNGVHLSVQADNASPSLAEARQVALRIQVINHTNHLVTLNFPTTQRIEILVRTSEGKIISTWSEDQSFSPEINEVTINPGERIEYNENVPTREMNAGQSYFANVSVIGQTALSASIPITPRP